NRCSIAGHGTPIGKSRATAMKKLRRDWAGCRRLLRRTDSGDISRLAGEECKVLKVDIVGCGKIADSHASQIHGVKGCQIVGVCDRERLMAKQLYERFPVEQYFSDLTTLLSEAKPHVVHVITPTESH